MTAREGVPDPWPHAIQYATGTQDREEALTGILGEAGRATGAHNAALVDLEAWHRLAHWRGDAATLAVLIRRDGPLAAILAREPAWPREPVLHAPAGADGGLLVVPVRMREVTNAALLLFLREEWPPAPEVRHMALAMAGLLALTLDHHAQYEEARRGHQARDHFLTALHHELRTPATALLLDIGTLAAGVHGPLPERLDKTLSRVEHHVAELVAVAGRVLDLAALEAGAPPEADDLVDPRAHLLELLRTVEPSVKRKGLRLAVYVPRSLPLLQTDRERFSRVLLHLLSNALRYTDQGGIEVRLERRTGEGAGRRGAALAVQISDTGSGIPAEERERVFEPFAQVDEGARTVSDERGIGLGLPLARKLARSLGGDVRVESSSPTGTTVSFLLPYRQPSG